MIKLKPLGKISLVLLLIGVIATVYFPPQHKLSLPRADIIAETLSSPIDYRQLLPSQYLLNPGDNNNNAAEAPLYALQLGLFSQLGGAELFIQNFTANSDPPIAASPVVVKVIENQQPWYITALGPFSSQQEQDHYQQVLAEQGIKSYAILWPSSTINPAKK